LFPWINPPFESIQSMHESFKTPKDPIGIAITGGKKHFYLITHLILTIRKEFNITLPVQVFYSGQLDMPQQYTKKFNRMENVEAIDLTQFFPIETTQFSGWSCKPFAMLAASFQTVLFIDADSLFFQSPLRALESRAFKETGMVFFRDRKLRHKDLKGAELLNAAGKHLSSYALSIPFTNASDTTAESHVLDSGFVVLNKGNLGVLYSLLLAAKMNSQVERDTLYSHTWGDKEAYWFASEMLRVPYRLNPTFGSAIGYRKKVAQTNRECVCGAFLLQLDERGDLFWWNGGGVLKDRYAT
ncbi:alpha-mannosyltransferase, partial [Chytriomyces cf. hyalinus JEL632]